MRGSKSGFITSLVIIAVAAILLSGVAQAGQSLNPPTTSGLWPVWPAYHADMIHNGHNYDSDDIENPASLGLVWIFPRADADFATEDDLTVDDYSPDYFYQYKLWTKGTNEDAYEYDDTYESTPRYHRLKAVPSDWESVDDDYANEIDYVYWFFPHGRTNVSPGFYKIWVWVPVLPDPEELDDPVFTTQAIYRVHDDNGVTEVTFDQTDGGTWQLLTDQQFSFRDNTKVDSYYVELSNVTDDTYSELSYVDEYTGETTDEYDTYVAVDAIRFEKGTGMEIYSSPVSATIHYDWTHTWEHDSTGVIPDQQNYTGTAPVVIVGTVEPPLTNETDAPDTGAIYCIDSVTPTTEPFELDADAEASGDYDYHDYHSPFEELAENLGTEIWRYPKRDADARHPLEGPLEGGVYSTPTLGYLPGGQQVCYFTGSDRQIYALDADTGDLLWKGPGLTVSEDPPSTWSTMTDREDAFGGNVAYAATENAPITWLFDQTSRNSAGEPAGGGWSYAVYAWIPPASGDSAGARTVGTYTIYYDSDEKATVSIDQSDVENQGKWVNLGSSYFNVDSVTLVKSDSASSTGIIVADVMMIVPDTVGAFSYCSPVVDNSDELESYVAVGAQDAQKVYAVTATGRALCFAADGAGFPDEALCTVNWIYPKIRTVSQITDPDQADDPSMGLIGASPAYADIDGERLYIATLDGEIRCINAAADGGTEIWTYEDIDDSSEDGSNPPFGEVINMGGFTSSPTIDIVNKQLFIGSVTGYFYCLDASASKDAEYDAILKWRYPENNADAPLGAFRYSTAVMGYGFDDGHPVQSTAVDRVWIGSTDGNVYTFNASSGSTVAADDRRLWVESDLDEDDGKTIIEEVHGEPPTKYFEPSLLSPIQGSIACDAADTATTYESSVSGATVGVDNKSTMFVGDMAGLLHWYSANAGRSDWEWDHDDDTDTDLKNYTSYQTDGELFSSPNVTSFKFTDSGGSTKGPITYVYVGGSDGRIYAFSHENGAWGGKWAGGYWPFAGDPYDPDNRKIEKLAPDAEVQFDIFPSDVYDNTYGLEPSTKVGVGDAQPCIVSEEMKDPGLANATNEAEDEAIDEDLRTKALEQRDFVYPVYRRDGKTVSDPIYFEWGETINCIVWNLPGREFLYGRSNSSKRGAIRINMTNTSAGESAGSQLKMTGRVRKLVEYNVLNSSGDALTYSDGEEVTRCYALATIKINSSGRRPPSPGPGWTLTAQIRTKQTSGSKTYVTQIIPLARLMNTDPPKPFVANDVYQEQLLGINNPLAIRDDGNQAGRSVKSLAWPPDNNYRTRHGSNDNDYYSRRDDEAHYNGNAIYDGTTASILLVTDLLTVNHGAASREARLRVMDRSATSTSIRRNMPRTLDNFRISAGELRFNGGDASIENSGGIKFPWEFGAGSADYPNIYKQRQVYRKASDAGDPANSATSLPALIGPPSIKDYDNCTMRPETVFVGVNVPRFQPANWSRLVGGSQLDSGYSRRMEAYIDSDRDKSWDSGNVVVGKPSTYQEAYRRFIAGVRVAPDPKIEVEQQTIDVGRAPHGLGVGRADFSPFNPDSDVSQWFKEVTIKNAGNVNLSRMYIDRAVPMFSAQAGANSKLPEGAITSSLDYYDLMFTSPKNPPFITGSLGYTLTKAKVGDPDPSVMTIPDKRKFDMNYDSAKSDVASFVSALNSAYNTNIDTDEPLPVRVGVRVPLTQPLGSYFSYDTKSGYPYVSVFSDKNGDGVRDLDYNNSYEPMAETSFQLLASVRETQMTGGITPLSLPHIDVPTSEDTNNDGVLDPGEDLNNNGVIDEYFSRVGDATPAAYRDANTGDVHLFWSSNRLFDSSLNIDYTDFANAPWFIDRATLHWQYQNQGDVGWLPSTIDGIDQWWDVPTTADTATLPSTGGQWPDMTNLMLWKNLTVNGVSTDFYSVRHHSPVIAQTLTSTETKADDPTWLSWVGAADKQDTASQKVYQDHYIFYTNATGGDVTDPSRSLLWIDHDPAMAKRSPSPAVYGNRMWMFWQAGDKGKWSIRYSTNDTADFPMDMWAEDATLRTPDCLSSVSCPNCIFRRFWGSLTGSNPDYVNGSAGKQLLDIVYAGTNKYARNSDIMLGRYRAVNQNNVTADPTLESEMPKNAAQPLPRVFDEQLRRDPKYGYYVSHHLAWMRPYLEETSVDNWGGYGTSADPDVNPNANPDAPYVRVYFPAGYTLPGEADPIGKTMAISATDASVWNTNDAGVLAKTVSGVAITPVVDDATGIYTYSYPTGSLAKEVLGDMLVDFSAGVVRFTEPLNEFKVGDEFVSPQVRADYTPQTWRITTDAAVDNSPRAFIERTEMTSAAHPGLGNTEGVHPIDRLWVFWRKAGTGVDTSTIFYKTYRVGIDLTKLNDPSNPDDPLPAVRMNSNGTVVSLTVTGNLGPWEVNRAGTKIYFSEVDERYRSLSDLGGPGSIKLSYEYLQADGTTGNITDVSVQDVYWTEEIPEQSLMGFSSDGNVNEGSIYAFADPDPRYYQINYSGSGTWSPLESSKIWVFWTSTRGGTSDLFWEVLSPNLAAD